MIQLLAYERLPADCLPWDSRFPAVAAIVAEAIVSTHAKLHVEHIGSSSIPGCAGKGVIDLLVLYPPGGLEHARGALDAMGFQRQGGRDPWPEERPMRVGAVEFDGARFRIHAHVVQQDAKDARGDIEFRDRMREDPALVERYVAEKQRILASGVCDPVDYAYAKGDFIQDLQRSWHERA